MLTRIAHIITVEVGALATCCYVVAGKQRAEAVVIDPGADGDVIIDRLRREELAPEMILLTHSHYDHIGAVETLMEQYPEVCLACHSDCGDRIIDPIKNFSAPITGVGHRVRAPGRILVHDETFVAGGVHFRAIHLPGHAPGHMVFHAADAGLLFAGDTIFAGGIGRTDLPHADHDLLVRGLRALLEELPPDTRIYPGHGPATTVGREIAENPFLG